MTARFFTSDTDSIRQRIAATAAKIIAEEGASYETAKKNAVRIVLGNTRVTAAL